MSYNSGKRLGHWLGRSRFFTDRELGGADLRGRREARGASLEHSDGASEDEDEPVVEITAEKKLDIYSH